jgi:uncharacterized membrane protein YfcA
MEPLQLNLQLIALLSLTGFAAGLLDSIVGGGGLIGTPAMINLFPGWSILNIVGTNRSSSIFGTSVAAWNYFRHVKLEPHIVFAGCGGAFLAALGGVQLAKQIPTERLKWIVLCMIVVLAIYSVVKKEFGHADRRAFSPRTEMWAALAVGSACGFYNGLIGPGTGTLLVFGFVGVLGLDFLKSSAVSKAANVAADVSSFAVLLLSGFVVWAAAIPLIVGNMLGSFIGSKLAILKGSKFIRRVFLVVVFALIGRLLWQVLAE